MVENRRFIKFCRSTNRHILHKFAVNVRLKTNYTVEIYRPEWRRFLTGRGLNTRERTGTPFDCFEVTAKTPTLILSLNFPYLLMGILTHNSQLLKISITDL